MTLTQTTDGVGDRIKARRLELGKSLRVIAGQAGISSSHLDRIEKGITAGSNRFHIAAIAKALGCPVEELTGTVVPGGRDGALTRAAANDTIRALLDADLTFPTDATPPPSVGHLAALADQAITYRQQCDYARLTRMLPGLIRDLRIAAAGPDRDRALRLLARCAEAASFAVRYTGQPYAAPVASDYARHAAAALGDPVMIAFGEWARAHSALGCGLHARAGHITANAIRDLDAATDAGPGRLEMLGMLHLTHAFSMVGAGRSQDAVNPLAEAYTLAQSTGETSTLALMFGPTNVRLWELAILTDGGDPLDALALSADINVQLVPSASRQATFYIDVSRAAALVGETDRACKLLETAERIAPQRVHGDPIVVETVRGLLEAARRRATGTRLRGLAQRMEVPA